MTSPFEHEPRRRFSPRERAEFFAGAKGHCQKCTRKIPHGDDWDLDHAIPLSLGGSNADDNIQVICSWCHGDKTSEDSSAAAKSKRVYINHVVPKRFRTPWNRNRWARK